MVTYCVEVLPQGDPILKDFKEVQFLMSLSKLFHKLVALLVKVHWLVAVLQIGI